MALASLDKRRALGCDGVKHRLEGIDPSPVHAVVSDLARLDRVRDHMRTL